MPAFNVDYSGTGKGRKNRISSSRFEKKIRRLSRLQLFFFYRSLYNTGRSLVVARSRRGTFPVSDSSRPIRMVPSPIIVNIRERPCRTLLTRRNSYGFFHYYYFFSFYRVIGGRSRKLTRSRRKTTINYKIQAKQKNIHNEKNSRHAHRVGVSF